MLYYIWLYSNILDTILYFFVLFCAILQAKTLTLPESSSLTSKLEGCRPRRTQRPHSSGRRKRQRFWARPSMSLSAAGLTRTQARRHLSDLYLYIYAYICSYLHIFVHICVYLCISVHICLYPKFSFWAKKSNFRKKFLFKIRSQNMQACPLLKNRKFPCLHQESIQGPSSAMWQP